MIVSYTQGFFLKLDGVGWLTYEGKNMRKTITKTKL